jgi:hypothetical protein
MVTTKNKKKKMHPEPGTNKQMNEAQIPPTTTVEPPRGLLVTFVLTRIRNYTEPQRKGTPKGQKIGFSRKKYAASLYELTSMKRKVTAQTLNVPYLVLLQWRADPEWLALIEQHRQAFVDQFITHVEALETQGRGLTDEQVAEIYADASLYGAETLRGIMQRVEQAKGSPLEQLGFHLTIFPYVFGIVMQHAGAGATQKPLLQLLNMYVGVTGNLVKELVHQMPQIPPKHQPEHRKAFRNAMEAIVKASRGLERMMSGNNDKEEETGDGK